jgi:hypothetical protein
MRDTASNSNQIPIITVVYEPGRDPNGNFTWTAGVGRSYVSFFNRAAYEHLSRNQRRRIHAILQSPPPFYRPKANSAAALRF